MCPRRPPPPVTNNGDGVVRVPSISSISDVLFPNESRFRRVVTSLTDFFPTLSRTACLLVLVVLGVLTAGCGTDSATPEPETVRFLTYNIEDVRTEDVRRTDHPRLTRAAARLQHLQPDVFLFNEITYDQPGDPGFEPGDPPGQNAQRFADHYLARAQADSLQGLEYEVVMLPVNTGLPSGFDLNNDGRVTRTVPTTPGTPLDGSVAPQTQAGRAYGGDAWGFGTFPGQYGMALFVRSDLTVLRDSIRTFRLFPWSELPDAAVPVDSTTGDPFYSDAEWEVFRLSSKSHWDIPVRLPDGRVVHVLASHPTPPGFDGAADRNGRRNHDEIRFWQEYIRGSAAIVDDSSRAGGLRADAAFVVMGDLNADPDEGDGFGTPMQDLFSTDRVHPEAPEATDAGQAAFPDLDPDDTARWGLRVDYVLPSTNLTVTDRGVWRPTGIDATDPAVSDHFPVWVDVALKP